jgi:curli biogenesis system outer membrane secretion channel CsgG
MLRLTPKTIVLTIIAAVSITACGDEPAGTTSTSTSKAAAKFAERNATSPGKPSAPIAIDYEVLGKAIASTTEARSGSRRARLKDSKS